MKNIPALRSSTLQLTSIPETSITKYIVRIPKSLYIISVCLMLGLYFVTLTPANDDFKVYYQAAASVRVTHSPYTQAPSYIYPPLLAYLVQPLSFLPQGYAQQVWFFINVGLLALLFLLCRKILAGIITPKLWSVIALAVVIAPPIRLCLQLGQIGLLIAVLLTALFACERHTFVAGLCLALASMLKIYPALFGLFLLARRSWALASMTTICVLGLFASTLISNGLIPYRQYLSNAILSHAPAQAEFNISFYGFWSRLFITSKYAVPIAHVPALALLLTALSSLVVVVLVVRMTTTNTSILYRQLLFSAWLVGMSLLSPINGYYNLVVLLFPLLSLVQYMRESPSPKIQHWLVLATLLLYVPPAWADSIPWIYKRVHTGWGLLFLTPSLYGLLLLLGLLLVALRNLQAFASDRDATGMRAASTVTGTSSISRR